MATTSRNAVGSVKRQFDVLFATTPKDPCYKQVRYIASYLKRAGFTVCLPEDHDVGKQKTTTLTENIKRSKCFVFPISRYKPTEEKIFIEDHAITTALKYKKCLLVPMLLDDQTTIPDKFNQYNPLDACDYTSEAGLKTIADRLKRALESTDQTGDAQNADIHVFLNQLGDDGKQYTMDELTRQGFRPSEQHAINRSSHIITGGTCSDDSTRYNYQIFNRPTEQRNVRYNADSSTEWYSGERSYNNQTRGHSNDGSYIRHRTQKRSSNNRTSEQRNVWYNADSSTDWYSSEQSYNNQTRRHSSDGSDIRHRTQNRSSDNRTPEQRNVSLGSATNREQRSRSFFEKIKELIWSLISPIYNYLFPSYMISS